MLFPNVHKMIYRSESFIVCYYTCIMFFTFVAEDTNSGVSTEKANSGSVMNPWKILSYDAWFCEDLEIVMLVFRRLLLTCMTYLANPAGGRYINSGF